MILINNKPSLTDTGWVYMDLKQVLRIIAVPASARNALIFVFLIGKNWR
jgi:hypothetical protein